MILPLSRAADAWDLIRGFSSGLASSSAAPGPVLVFVAAPDPDALAAARTLTALLKADLVRYELHPVAGYAHLSATFKALIRGDAPVNARAVVCVNCGAGVDLGVLLELKKPRAEGEDGADRKENDDDDDDALKVFVIDSHRPYHLRNVSSSIVCVFDDSTDDFDASELPLDVGWEDPWGNVADVDDPDSDSEPGSESESESESESDSGADSNSDIGDDADDDKTPPGGRKKKKSKQKRPRVSAAPQRRKRVRRGPDEAELVERRALRDYYAAAPAGMASACVAHSLAALLRRASPDTLWAAIVGITHQYLAGAVVPAVYTDAVEYCTSQISALCGPGSAAAAATSGNDSGVQDGPVQNAGYAQIMSGEDGMTHSIVASAEFRLDLVRHWTLHDSLLYSSYTVTRMAAWRQTGRRRLMELLATLGIPLKESKQQWCYMKAECKAALDDRLATSVRRFDLGKDIQYDSFVRILPGHRGKISAADVVYGVSALLELDGIDPDNGGLTASNGQTAAEVVSADSIDLAVERRFWCAYDAMDTQRSDALAVGLDLAIMSQKLAAEIGGEVIERRRFVPSGPFRYVFLRDMQCKELFAHPLLLKRLALFLIEAITRQGARDKPFIVLAPNPTRGVWLAVAAMSVGNRNDFGQRFRRAAEKNGSQITFDGFETAACEIQDGQETEFIRFLHDVMV
jgi:cell division control protein 45